MATYAETMNESAIIYKAKMLTEMQKTYANLYYKDCDDLYLLGVDWDKVHVNDVRVLADAANLKVAARNRRTNEYPIELSVIFNGVRFISIHDEDILD